MAKFTGFMCDVCKGAENGNDRPEHWLGLRLPLTNGTGETRDLCSDKCLLKFARERSGIGVGQGKNPARGKVPGLSEFLDTKGVKPAAKGAISAGHARQRHEMSGAREDCFVCEFLAMEEG